MLPAIRYPHIFCLIANEKDFSLSLEMTMRKSTILPPSSGRRCPEGAEVGFLFCGEAATTTLNPEP